MRARWPVKIAGVGHYLPERVVPSSEVAALCGVDTSWVVERSGVRERRWADQAAGETNSYMAARAAEEALEEAGIEARDLDLILNASGSNEQAIPDGAPFVQRQLGLGESGIPCMSVHATCLSFLGALDVAASFITGGRYERILIVSSEIASAALDFQERESGSLFGDAAAAAVVVPTPEGESSGIRTLRFATYGVGAELTEVRGGGTRRHPNHPDTTPEDNLFHMRGPEVLKLAIRHVGRFMESVRPGLSRGLGDIRVVIPHQPSLAGIRALRALGYPDDKVVLTLDRLGNTIAACIPVTLHAAVREGRLERGDEFLLVGTGAGLSFGAAVCTY
ncbi:MAG: 3-oxoacyl-[acyl-carrier-protein] synthase III C-terminal domain-containing protein [Myxococcota bacterium]